MQNTSFQNDPSHTLQQHYGNQKQHYMFENPHQLLTFQTYPHLLLNFHYSNRHKPSVPTEAFFPRTHQFD